MIRVEVDVALQWNTTYQPAIFSFANAINTHEGGTHMVGFRTALTRVVNAYARANGLLKEKDENLSGEDVAEGLAAVISVRLPEPQFEGQTKTKLGNTHIRGIVDSASNTALAEYFEEHPAEAKAIVAKIVEAARAGEAGKVDSFDIFQHWYPNMLHALRVLHEGGGGLLWNAWQSCGEPFFSIRSLRIGKVTVKVGIFAKYEARLSSVT